LRIAAARGRTRACSRTYRHTAALSTPIYARHACCAPAALTPRAATYALCWGWGGGGVPGWGNITRDSSLPTWGCWEAWQAQIARGACLAQQGGQAGAPRDTLGRPPLCLMHSCRRLLALLWQEAADTSTGTSSAAHLSSCDLCLYSKQALPQTPASNAPLRPEGLTSPRAFHCACTRCLCGTARPHLPAGACRMRFINAQIKHAPALHHADSRTCGPRASPRTAP